ncbi:glycoside hydrolase [Nocardiopsis sediminis]|uniref:Glycoside hydrolase n=1 Tax=Nocardiopsis sediminis TaxID=1778267 RepID=A0ABV8FK17_9ACTN
MPGSGRSPRTDSAPRPAYRAPRPHRPAATLAAAMSTVLALTTAGTAAADAPGAADTSAATAIRLDPSYQQPEFEGWGTALIWFANVTGHWPEEQRAALADALFGEDGLRFTIARYNIGGGDSPETEPYMRAGGAVPGHWHRPDEFGPPDDPDEDWQEPAGWWDPADPEHWDHDADAAQLWWLEAARQRGADTFEAFSNSPPYFMTESGLTSGNTDPARDNLRPDQYEEFAAYLAGTVEHIEGDTGIDFASLSPVNEPNTDYWEAGGRQEGSHWDPASQARIVSAARAELDRRGLDTPIAAMDETNPTLFRTNWESYGAQTRADIGRLNVHTYGTDGRAGPRDIAKGSDTPLWMSEVDLGPSGIPQDFDAIEPGLALSERITDDLTQLEPGAWVLWQAIEDYENMRPDRENMNWGLIQVDFTPEDAATEPIRMNKKYYAMGNYSRFIEPGAHVIADDDPDTVAATGRAPGRVVVVHTNPSGAARDIDVDLGGFASVAGGATATPHTTSASRNLEEGAPIAVDGDHLRATVEAGSVTTFVIDGAEGVDPGQALIRPGSEYGLTGSASGLDLAAAEDGTVVQTGTPDGDAGHWTFQPAGDGWDSRTQYTIANAATGTVLSADGGELALAPPGSGADQRWMVSTTGQGEVTVVNAGNGLLLDVLGDSRDEGAPVGVWRPTTGANQVWDLAGAD